MLLAKNIKVGNLSKIIISSILFIFLYQTSYSQINDNVSEILVEVTAEIDLTKLPWPSEGEICHVPAQEISQIGSRIVLRR